MRFHVGPIPEDADFDPEADGWVRLREPRPAQLMFVAVPLGMLMAGVLAFAWSLVVRFETPGDTFSLTISLPGLLTAVVALTGFIVLHESLHALPAMVIGPSNGVVMGFWPRHLAPYVACVGALSREAQLVSGAMPFVLLTMLPFVVALTIPRIALWMAGLSVLNVLGSAADLIMLGLLVHQVPRKAVVRSQGFSTWWRPAV